MARQAVSNGPMTSRDRPNNGVIEGVSSFGTDLATLAVLQMRLVACDIRECARDATPIVAALTVLWIIAGASAAVGLAGLALWLATVLKLQTGIVMMVVAFIGLIVSVVAAVILARSLSQTFSYFRRSQEELDRNLAWVKTTLVHSGR